MKVTGDLPGAATHVAGRPIAHADGKTIEQFTIERFVREFPKDAPNIFICHPIVCALAVSLLVIGTHEFTLGFSTHCARNATNYVKIAPRFAAAQCGPGGLLRSSR